MCGQAAVGGQGIMACPDAAKLEHDVWVLMQRISRYETDLAAAQARAEGLLLVIAELKALLTEAAHDALPRNAEEAAEEAHWYERRTAALAHDPEARADSLLVAKEEG